MRKISYKQLAKSAFDIQGHTQAEAAEKLGYSGKYLNIILNGRQQNDKVEDKITNYIINALIKLDRQRFGNVPTKMQKETERYVKNRHEEHIRQFKNKSE